jgi:hypothetical protein
MKRQRTQCLRCHESVCLTMAISFSLCCVAVSLSLPSSCLLKGPSRCWKKRIRIRQSTPCFLKREDVSDHFFDEADELLSFAGMLEGEQQFDYNILSGDSRSLGMDATNATNALDAQQGSKETSSTILVSDGAHNYNESKPTCSSNPDTIDNLIVPDLNTLLSNLQLAPASEIAYFYLQNTLGLEPEVMWKITNTAGSVLGFTVQNRELLKFPRLMTHSLFKIKHVVGYLRIFFIPAWYGCK